MVPWCKCWEMKSIKNIILKLEKQKNIKKILITSNTLSSAKIFKNLKLKKQFINFFQLIQFDAKKFINCWSPENFFRNSKFGQTRSLILSKKKFL